MATVKLSLTQLQDFESQMKIKFISDSVLREAEVRLMTYKTFNFRKMRFEKHFYKNMEDFIERRDKFYGTDFAGMAWEKRSLKSIRRWCEMAAKADGYIQLEANEMSMIFSFLRD